MDIKVDDKKIDFRFCAGYLRVFKKNCTGLSHTYSYPPEQVDHICTHPNIISFM